MALDLTALQAEIARDEAVNSSAITLIASLVAEIEANVEDPAALTALVERLKASQDGLAAAVSANTPGA